MTDYIKTERLGRPKETPLLVKVSMEKRCGERVGLKGYRWKRLDKVVDLDESISGNLDTLGFCVTIT